MADAAAARMSRMTLQSNIPTLLEKRPPGTAGRAVEINTNITPITLNKNMTYYKYDIRMYGVFTKRDGTEVTKEFSKQTKDDFEEQERKKACTEIFRHMVLANADFRNGSLIYDRAAILFTTQKLDKVLPTDTMFPLPGSSQTVSPDAIRVEVTIKQAATSFEVTSANLADCVNADFKNKSKELMEVLNLATSQIPFLAPDKFITFGTGNIYLMNPMEWGFKESELPTIGKDKFIGVGLSKSVKILEGTNPLCNKDYMPALVLDVKKTAFHYEKQNLADKIMAMYGNSTPTTANLNRDLRDIRCMTIHKKPVSSVLIGSFTNGAVSASQFKDNHGKCLSIVQYYEQKYNIKIMRPDLPGVIDKHTKNIYPPELLITAPSQRVKGTQATKECIEQLIKVSAIKPDLRFQQTHRLSALLELSSQDAQNLGVMVPEGQPPLSVPARQMPTVALLGGQGGMSGPNWRSSAKFVVGAKVEKWATFLFYNSNSKGGRYDPMKTFADFVKKLVEAGNRKGMSIAQPEVVDNCDSKGQHVEPYITMAVKRAAEAGCSYVLIISDDRMKTHEQLKHDELQFRITTQEVTLSKASQVAFESKQQTLENILMKMNAKLRGMNHVCAKDGGLYQGSDTIVMGIFIQQPQSMTAADIEKGSRPSIPAVIGLSANNGDIQAAPKEQRDMAAQQYFTTAWKYAHPKEWTAGEAQHQTLKKMIIDALVQFKTYRGSAPMKVVVYRGGASEGQLPYIASVERDAFHGAFKELAATYNPALVMIACSKEHNERFYPKAMPSMTPGQRAPDMNLAPGIVVDKVAVNPELNEFYLQSHKALQGTARATKYTMLHESTGAVSNDKIQQMTHALCHLHEIVNSTTAIPTPLYVAEESAKRAVNIYHHAKGGAEWFDLDEINQDLSPNNLAARINA